MLRATLIAINTHEAIPLVVPDAGVKGTVNRDLQVVGSQAVQVGIVV